MLRRLFAPVLILTLGVAFGLAGCDSKKDAENPTGTTTAAEPTISYGQGFYQLERDSSGNSWHWMGGEGVLKLKNSSRDMKLAIAGSVPMDVFPQTPTMRVILNGEQLDQFPAVQNVVKEYTVPAAKLSGKAYSELKITTDKTFVPKERDKKSSDDRQLGFSLLKLDWEPK